MKSDSSAKCTLSVRRSVVIGVLQQIQEDKEASTACLSLAIPGLL